jgi:hypothetical protein
MRFKMLVVASVVIVAMALLAQEAFTPYATTVVSKSSFVNHTGSLSSTVIYTPPSTRDYRVSVYVEENLDSYQPTATVSWTGIGGQQKQESETSPFGTMPGYLSFPVRATSGNAITLSVSTNSLDIYSVYVTIEKL